ncbi:MAG: hypothetical protein G01um101466_372 [Parcubacteria group bacterium Gr01-1014_66]|nr:MAG: hypothetical protein G01um101466_372 [Parcubacteria group bacterium Gr01-1014_66]
MDKLKLDYLQILRAAKPGEKFWGLTSGIVSIILMGNIVYAVVLFFEEWDRREVIHENKILQAVYKPHAIDDLAVREAAEKLRGFFDALDAQYPGDEENRLALKGYQSLYKNKIDPMSFRNHVAPVVDELERAASSSCKRFGCTGAWWIEKIDAAQTKLYEIAKTIWYYNQTRIHTVLKMPPALFARRHGSKLVENYSKKRGT